MKAITNAEFFLDYVNNYLTTSKMAEDYNITESEVLYKIKLGRVEHESNVKSNILSSSHLHGKYPEINSEIDTKLPYVAIGDFFTQGEDADTIIEEINLIYNKENCTAQEAIQKWQSLYL